jgi:hypothetical protein
VESAHFASASAPDLVENGNGSVSTFMSSTAGGRGSPSERVRQYAEVRALDEAKKVPWRLLANAADEYTEWQIFALWLRAVLNVCEVLPAEVANEVETRSPALLSQVQSRFDILAPPRGGAVWEAVNDWAESTVFVEAKRDRWLNAIRYFSSTSLSSMKAWSYWESIHRRCQEQKPEYLLTYPEWISATYAVRRLSNPEGDAQKVLDSIGMMPEARWQLMFEAFAELTALCLWIETVLGIGQMGAALVTRELKVRHPGFEISSIQNSGAAISGFMEWVIASEVPFVGSHLPLTALAYQTKRHPAYHARRNYAAQCRAVWSGVHFDRLPSFEEWRDAADAYLKR